MAGSLHASLLHQGRDFLDSMVGRGSLASRTTLRLKLNNIVLYSESFINLLLVIEASDALGELILSSIIISVILSCAVLYFS